MLIQVILCQICIFICLFVYTIYYKTKLYSNHIMNIMSFSTEDYLMPKWAALPKYHYFFEVLKDGCIISKIQIKNKQFSLIGRLQDLCDIFIDNPTVSRKHAILQFSQDSSYPLLYDLGNTHGTCVNKQKLPPRIYKKIQPFANIKFGISSRSYILRCPQLQQKQMNDQAQKQNQFMKTLQTQTTKLTKQQMKDKYLELLENDPYSGNQIASRKFVGRSSQNNQQKIDGIDWGISDQNQVYGYRNDHEFPIQTDIMRRLPGLDQIMLDKLADYQQKFRMYDQIQGELNELANKQKRQYGLQEKLQTKKQRLQKKFVQSMEALQKSQNWIRQSIFGDESAKIKKIQKKKQKEADTYSDDQFYDRTLQNKNKHENKQGVKQKQVVSAQMMSVEDFWQMKKVYVQKIKQKQQILKKSDNNNENLAKEGDEDQFEAFMKQTNQKLLQENKIIQDRQLETLQKDIQILRVKLLPILGDKQLLKIQNKALNKITQKVLTEQQKNQIKQKQNKQMLQKTFAKLAQLQKQREREKLNQEQVDIFKYYEGQKIEDQQQIDSEEQFNRLKRGRILRQQQIGNDKIVKKNHYQQSDSESDSDSQKQENVYDLTKFS